MISKQCSGSRCYQAFNDRGGREMQLIQSGQLSSQSTGVPLRQFSHRKLHVPAVVSDVTGLGAESGVFKAVATHPGVLVVDRVDEDEDNGDCNDGDRHKSSYEGQVILCKESNHKRNMLMFYKPK